MKMEKVEKMEKILAILEKIIVTILRQAGPSPRGGGAEGGRVPPSRLPAVRWWCGSPIP